MRRVLFSVSLFALLCLAAIGSVAASGPIDFESGYLNGNINTQNGWSKTGSYDANVVDVSGFANAASFGFGAKTLQVSNAVTSGSFGDQTFAPPVSQAAGESGNGHFDASFDLGAAQSAQQTGLILSVSPDDGTGGRMSYLRFEDQGDGIHVFFDDTTDAGPLGTVADFNDTDIATLSRTSAHHIEFSIYFAAGPHNDLVKIFIDSVLKATGTTWEDYYRYDPEQNGNGNLVPSTSTLIFRAGGTAVPANAGNGYLFDNIALSSSAVTQCTTTCYVDATNGSDGFGGTSPSDAKKHIQAAIDAVSPNGSIHVLPGHYQEGPNPGTSQTGPDDTFGLVFPEAKSGVSVIGVNASDVAISDANATLADVTTVGTAGFGPDGMFVEASGVTIQGLTINGNLDASSMTESDNKTIEVIGDNFTLKYAKTNVPNGGGSVYINDWTTDSSVVKAYHVLNNEFADGSSVDIASGAGVNGPVSSREIKNNHFDLNDNGFNGVSFNGTVAAIGWFLHPVGGAVITGNTFENSTQYIRARGTYDNSQFDWKSYFNDNTFQGAAMAGTDPANGILTAYAYDCGYGAGSCPNTRRIAGTIQGAIDHATAGDTVLVKAATYPEQVTLGINLTLKGTAEATTIIKAPASMTAGPGGRYSIVSINNGASASMADITVAGPGPSGCGSIHNGIFVYDNAYLSASHITVTSVRDAPLSGCQNGAGIVVGRGALSTYGTADLDHVTVTDYQKTGVVFSGASSGGSITNSTVTGVGATNLIAQNGIQVSEGAVATVSGNNVSGNECDVAVCGPDFMSQTQSIGVLLFNSGAGTLITGNDVSANDIGVYNLGSSTIQGNTVHANRYVGVGLDQGSATLTANTISGGNTGVFVASFDGNTGDTAGTATNNSISGAAVQAIRVEDQNTGDSALPTVVFHDNTITGNVANVTANLLGVADASANWWGSNSETTINGGMSGNVDFTPFLDNGTDTDVPTAGFQGDFHTLHVTALGSQAGATGRIQEGVDLVAGSTVLVGPGTFTENVTVATSGLDLRGAQYGVSYNSRTFAGAGESTLNGQLGLQAANIKIDGFSIENHVAVDSTALGIYIKTAGSGASISNNILGAILADYHGSQSHGLAIYLENGPDNVTITNNKIDGVHGWVSSQGILVGDSTATDASTGVDIEANLIKNVTSDTKGAYGIQTNNNTGAGLTITGNELDTLTGSWVHAIAFEGPTTVADVELNTVANLLSAGADRIAVFFENDAPFVSATVHRNNLDVGNDRYGVVNATVPALDATCNWWGDSAGPNSTNGSDTAGTVTVAPWLIANDLINGDCTAIAVHDAGAADANGNEGSVISTSGSFDGSIASITADNAIGTFTPNAPAGTWTWSYTPTDNYTATTINVTGHGTNGTTAVDSFSTSAANVNPTASALAAPASQLYNNNFNISLTSPTDVSSVDAGSLHYAFDCGSGYSAANYGAASITNSASCPAPAQAHSGQSITVKGKVFDKDGGSNEYTASVEILQPEISLTPASHDYGSVLVSSTSSSTTYTVKNVGTATLTVSNVNLGGINPGHFGIDTNNCAGAGGTLAANGTCTVLVFFHPLTSGAKTASLEVGSDDPITATAVSNLSGIGGVASQGTITIVLDAHPDGAQSFAFTGALGAFSLSDPSSNTMSQSKNAGTYVVQAKKVSGWSLLSLTCDTPESINKNKRKVTINLASGQNVTCTYTETKRLPDESIATSSGGPYTGVGVYTSSAQASQTLNQAIGVGQTKSYYVHLTNNSLDTDSFNVHSTLTGSTKFAVKFFNGATDISARVNAGTYNITLNAGQTITIQIQVKAVSGTPASATRNIDLTMKSKTSTSKDVVRGHVTRA